MRSDTRNSKRNFRQTGRRRVGASLVEAALVLPLVLLFLLGILDYGRYLMTTHLVQNAAREGARYAVVHTQPITIDGETLGNATSDVVDAIEERLGTTMLTNASVEVYRSDSDGANLGDWNDAESGEFICVRVTGDFTVVATGLLFLPNTLPLDVHAIMRSEAN